MKIAVVGGAGKQASGVIRDLGEAPEVSGIVLIDLERARGEMERRAAEWCRGKGQIACCDLNDHQGLCKALDGCAAAANCTSHVFNLQVMAACLAQKAHYTDMGGLFHWARKQMEQDKAWKEAGITAVLGMGSAPGIVNVLARYGADLLDRVESIHIRDGIVNFTKMNTPLAVPYAIGTILDEFVMNPYVFEDGDWKEMQPFARPEDIDFPPPVGPQRVFATIHSEVATVPVTFRDKGLKHMSFKLALPKVFEEKIRFLAELGLGAKDKIQVAGQEVSPRDVIVALCAKLPPPSGEPDDHKVLRVDVSGLKDGRPRLAQVEMICHPYEPWGMACGPFSVGFPVALTLRLLATGVITQRGSLPPEACVPPEPFFAGLAQRGLHVTCTEKYPVLEQ